MIVVENLLQRDNNKTSWTRAEETQGGKTQAEATRAGKTQAGTTRAG